MTEYPNGSFEDRGILGKMPKEKLLDFLFLQIRNLWRIDGLYFLGIEQKFGTETATEIDAEVWEIMAKIEAKSLQRMFRTVENPNVPIVLELLRKSSWALDQPFKVADVFTNRAILSVAKCRTQETRLSRGLEEFPCKKVRYGYLKSFAKTLNPNIEVRCLVCPPEAHPKQLWCKWEFTL